MKCRHCGSENPEEHRFCGTCGTPLFVPTTKGQESIRMSEQERTALLQYLGSTMAELAAAAERFLVAVSDGKGKNEDGNYGQAGGLFFTSISIAREFALLDGRISSEEARFIGDLMKSLGQSLLGMRLVVNDDALKKIQSGYVSQLERQVDYKSRVNTMIGGLEIYDSINNTAYAEKARMASFQIANAVIKADGKMTEKERAGLAAFKESLWSTDTLAATTPDAQEQTSLKQRKASEHVKPQSQENLLNELNTLVGLERVKRDVLELVNFLKVQQLRKSKGLPTPPVTLHLVFYGNPGTGKTTVARLLAQIYKSLGILSKGHLLETDRSGLVAGYVGQTALKVTDVVNKAIGGILFIDEAYSLLGSGGNDFGQEATETLLKQMEDHRDDLIVVVAGYSNKMEQFLSSNPGLRSRFTKYLYFDDYSPSQLVAIFELFCEKAGYQLLPPAKEKVARIFEKAYTNRDETFGNARLARNVFERTISNQANRIVSLADTSLKTLSTIESDDIPNEEIAKFMER